jgi:hypothetical protein
MRRSTVLNSLSFQPEFSDVVAEPGMVDWIMTKSGGSGTRLILGATN